MTREIPRRGFLKIAAGTVSAAAATQFLAPLISAQEQAGDRPWVDRCTGKKVAGQPSTCTGCGAGCGIITYVRSGQLLRISGNPAHPVNKGTLCLVGQAGLYRLYNPERVKKPLVRTGRRGENKWKEVSWEEAIKTVAVKLRNSRGGVVLETRGGSGLPASEEFIQKTGGRLLSHESIVSPNREAALSRTFGARYDWPDIANTDYVLNFGADPFESDPFGIGVSRPLAEFRATGGRTKMVSFDPRLSSTAGRSDEWFPLMPGTDAAVALAMAHVIIEEGLYNEAFVRQHTNISIPALAAHLASYTPSAAERISGIAAADIKRVAVEYAKADRACVLTGGGLSRQPQGTENERAVRLLPTLTGKINRPGCNVIPRADGWNSSGEPPEGFHKQLASGKGSAGVYILHGSDPAYSSPDIKGVSDALMDESRMPFIVVIDTDVTDTGMMADMILPVATYLEEYGVELSPGPGGEQVVGWRQPALMPVGESRPYVEILAAIASAAGRDLGYSDSEGYAEGLLSKLKQSGQVAELQHKGFLATSGQFPLAGSLGGIRTGSGRIEAAWSGRYPVYSSPDEYKNLGSDEFILIAFNPAGLREGFTENNLILKELFHDSRVYINSEVGRLMGLKSWEKVTLASASDKIEAQVILSPGIHPRAVAMARGCGHTGYGNIEKGKMFKSEDPFTEPIWWAREGAPGVNPARVMQFNIDKQSGGQGWMLSKVSIEKA